MFMLAAAFGAATDPLAAIVMIVAGLFSARWWGVLFGVALLTGVALAMRLWVDVPAALPFGALLGWSAVGYAAWAAGRLMARMR